LVRSLMDRYTGTVIFAELKGYNIIEFRYYYISLTLLNVAL